MLLSQGLIIHAHAFHFLFSMMELYLLYGHGLGKISQESGKQRSFFQFSS